MYSELGGPQIMYFVSKLSMVVKRLGLKKKVLNRFMSIPEKHDGKGNVWARKVLLLARCSSSA